MDSLSPQLTARFAGVRLFAMDVDGVLTDGGLWFDTSGESKRFDVRDGLGLRLLLQVGVSVAWITARASEVVARRASEIGSIRVLDGVSDKALAIRDLALEERIELGQVAYMGDDLNDLTALRLCGCACAPADATRLVRSSAHYVCRARGGHGAVREVAERILVASGSLEAAVEEYLANLQTPRSLDG